MGLLFAVVALFAIGFIALGLFADWLERWLRSEDEARTTEPPMWRHPMTGPGRRRS